MAGQPGGWKLVASQSLERSRRDNVTEVTNSIAQDRSLTAESTNEEAMYHIRETK